VSRRDPQKTRETLARLAEAEDAFLRSEFMAPVLRGGGVGVRIAGVRCTLAVEPADFEGWGVFRPASHTAATLVRPARMGERLRYLELFPAVALILCRKPDDSPDWFAAPASRGDSRFRIEGLAPVRLADDVDRFDTITARYDGGQFWFEQLDARADPGAAAYLRQSFAGRTAADALERPGLTAEQRDAYAGEVAYAAEQAALETRRLESERRLSSEGRLRDALHHAGAELRDFAERGRVYRVTYTVDGRRHTSVVDRHTLSVQTAGICLSGEDAKFDLASLVGVLRQGRGRR
jgi:hypothetical protein